MAKTLTAAAVKNFRPGKVRREIPDGGCPGLYLVIHASGRRSWAMRFRRPSGKPAKLTLGPVDLSGKEAEGEPVLNSPLTLASVRRLATEIHRQRAMGHDVVADHDASRRRQKSEPRVAPRAPSPPPRETSSSNTRARKPVDGARLRDCLALPIRGLAASRPRSRVAYASAGRTSLSPRSTATTSTA